MKTNLEFQSDAFPPYENEEAEVNPGRWGKRLAEYLAKELRSNGVEIKDIHCEDWGWSIHVKHDAFPMWIGCGNYDEYPNGFIVFIEPSKPFVRSGLFKKVDTTKDVETLGQQLESILRANTEVSGLRWWSQEERLERK